MAAQGLSSDSALFQEPAAGVESVLESSVVENLSGAGRRRRRVGTAVADSVDLADIFPSATSPVRRGRGAVGSSRGRGRPRGRPPRRGRPLGRNVSNRDDGGESDTSDTSRKTSKIRKETHDNLVHGNELYCICRTQYQADKFMIGCDRCDGWFHPDCVGTTTQQAMRMQSYTCPNCMNSGALPKKKRKRGVMTMPPIMNMEYQSILNPETIKRRMLIINDIASRLSNDIVSGPIDASLDTDVDMSSEEGEGRTLTIGLDCSESAKGCNYDLDYDVSPQPCAFEARDIAIIQILKRRRLQCDIALQVVQSFQNLIESALAFSRRESLVQRFDLLASSEVDIVKRTDRCLEPAIPPSLLSAVCLCCKGDIPIISYVQHLDLCVSDGLHPACVRDLSHSVVHNRHHHLDDLWIEENDRDGHAPLLVCGYPFALEKFQSTESEPSVSDMPTETKFCTVRRNHCIRHASWQEVANARLTQYQHIQRRRAKRLDDEIDDIENRLINRQQDEISFRAIANPKIPLPAPSAPSIHVSTHRDPSPITSASVTVCVAPTTIVPVSDAFQLRAQAAMRSVA